MSNKLIVVMGAVLAGVLMAIGIQYTDGMLWSRSSMNWRFYPYLAAITVLGMAFYLNWLKRRKLWQYAMIELMIGAAVGLHTSLQLTPEKDGLTQTLGLMAAIYLLVQALENLDKAFDPGTAKA